MRVPASLDRSTPRQPSFLEIDMSTRRLAEKYHTGTFGIGGRPRSSTVVYSFFERCKVLHGDGLLVTICHGQATVTFWYQKVSLQSPISNNISVRELATSTASLIDSPSYHRGQDQLRTISILSSPALGFTLVLSGCAEQLECFQIDADARSHQIAVWCKHSCIRS